MKNKTKNKKATWYCVFCDWTITTHQLKYESAKCPKCNGIITQKLVK